ncbi:MAG TPA: hypothetical protein VLI44_09595 [Sporolactobacillaceae bacterium]|nr:hypothetical protein [Sporolactobacillaceae bacterium]
MKPLYLTILALLFLATFTPAFAIEQPRIVPRANEVPKPIDEVFARLKKYFSDPNNHFQLVSADPRKHMIVAKQSGIGDLIWANWAFCKTGPVEMIYKYEDGTVTVTVKLEKTTKRSTFVSVSADFQGAYRLGSNENKVECQSKFALEDQVISAAGASDAK